jgi:aurora kinase
VEKQQQQAPEQEAAADAAPASPAVGVAPPSPPRSAPPPAPPLPSATDIIAASTLADWEEVAKLGEGCFGAVYKVRHRVVPELVCAMKVAKIKATDPSKPVKHCSDPANEWREMQILQHPNIVRCWRAWRCDATQSLHILIEFVQGKDLAGFFRLGRASRKLHGEIIGTIFVQLLWAVWYMGKKGMCHRDLKPENILVGFTDCPEVVKKDNFRGEVTAKITDFGFARTLPPPEADVDVKLSSCGTMSYMAPERLLLRKYDWTSDIWSLGLILVELITKEHLFAGYNETVTDLKYAHQFVKNWLDFALSRDWADENIPNLICGMLAYEPSDRWTAERIAEHEWVKAHMERNKITLEMPPEDLGRVANSDLTEDTA